MKGDFDSLIIGDQLYSTKLPRQRRRTIAATANATTHPILPGSAVTQGHGVTHHAATSSLKNNGAP